MTSRDTTGFTALMKRLGAVFRRRVDTDEFTTLTGTYYRALQAFELDDLERAADLWIGHQSKFPLPADLRSAIPRREVFERLMTVEESRDYHAAVTQGYETDPCGCQSCVEARVHQRPLRFVPEFDTQDRPVRVQDAVTGKVVTAGHWAHGRELFQWYDARAAFWNRCYELGFMTPKQQQKRERLPFEQQLEKIFAKKGTLALVPKATE